MANGATASARQRRMIGVSLGVESTAEAQAALLEVARSAHIAELRLDFMAEYDLPQLLQDRPCPVIVTNRPEREGGRFQGSEEERVRPLLHAIELGAEYVDIEGDAAHLIEDRKQTKLVVSHHDFQRMPSDITEVYTDLAAKGADVVKIVGLARSILDNLHMLDALAQADRPFIAIAMGEAGLISRVLALRYDACLLTYATLGEGEIVAPGQLPIKAMREIYHAERIGPKTAIYGVLSTDSVSDERLSSLNAAMRDADLDGVWLPFVAPGGNDASPADVLRGYRKLKVDGYIVDEPAQEVVSGALDDVASAGPDGRVNVVRDSEGRLIGQWTPDPQEAFALVTGR